MAPTPSRRLPFASVGWETPLAGTYSVFSMSASQSSSAVATDPPAAKRTKRTPHNTEGNGQAIKAMKQFGRAAQAAGAGIGAVVVLKVDYRTHSHAQGLIAIVYEMNESTGGILVCCEHGVVTHDGSRKDYWVPYDKNYVKARAQDTSPIEEAIQSLRNLVLEDRYNSTDQPRISCSKYH